MGIPTDLGAKSKRKGRIDAPNRLRELSEDWFIPLEGKIDCTRIFDAGNLSLDKKDMMKNIEIISRAAAEYLKAKKTLIVQGGDCSIKYGILKGLDTLGKKISVIYIDSHPDLVISKMPYYGSAMADCMRLKNIDFSNSFFIGIREIEDREMRIIREKNMTYFTPLDFRRKKINEIVDVIKKKVKGNIVYVSLDIDSVDPSMAPGVGCIAPGGLLSSDILILIDELKKLDPIAYLRFASVYLQFEDLEDFAKAIKE